jgi:hypothetical protein
MQPRHPEITVELIGHDGNAFNILARCRMAMRSARLPQAEIDAFMTEATAGDYNHLLQTAMRCFEVD